ncbi:cytochrome P450 71A1-like [Senna tora]|uniref:Cytochrome P450 71A1-like n=1 Tax=Senna tora TaxID=362788 RepID=A0A834X5Q8_9FABA|nr:cytochrome P450 71A1-like [Senna tora]
MDLFRVHTKSSILDTTILGMESLLNNNTTFYLSLFCLIITIFVFNFTTTRRNRANHPPSPPKLPFLGNLHQLGTLPHRTLRHLSHKYGPLMLLHFGHTPTLVVSSAEIAREIVKTHDVVFSDRPQNIAAKIFFYGCKDVGFISYGEEWRQKRKICVRELLSLNRVRSFQFIREEEVSELVTKIRAETEYNNGSPVINLSHMLIGASNNIVSRCVLGHKYDAPHGHSSFGDLARKMMILFVSPSFGDFFPSLWWMDFVTGLIPKLKASFGELDAFFDEVIAQHKTMKHDHQSDRKEKDFVDILLHLQEEAISEFELTQEDIKAILVDMFVGGSDTSSTALEWAMTELVRNASIMKKAQEEVRRVVGNKSKVEETDVKQMKYLNCVVKETLRLHPPGPLIPRKTRSSVKIRGYDIPPKTNVLINVLAIQTDPGVWERAEEFVPERFESSEIDFKGQDFEFIPFGNGRKGCPGMSFGVTLVEYVLANVLYWFDWKLPGSAQDIDMTETYGITANKKEPLQLQPVLVHS